MKLLFDQNLSPLLVALLADAAMGPPSGIPADAEGCAATITANALESSLIIDHRQDTSAVVHIAQGTRQDSVSRQGLGVAAEVLNLALGSAEPPQGGDQLIEYR